MRRFAAATLALVAALALATACARSVQVGSGPGPVYAIEVRNTMPHDMIVSYDDGSGARTLGTVQASGTERFIIAAPGDLAIRVAARDAGGTQTAGPFPVTLQAAETPVVTLR
jgi:hypothetical protein